jgi:hypothetical protein
MPRVRRRRSTAAAGALLVALLIGGVALVATTRGRSDGDDQRPATNRPPRITRTGSVVVDETPSDETTRGSRATPTRYHAFYETADAGATTVVRGTEQDWVRRPFDGRRELRTGTGPAAKLSQTAVWALGRFEVRNAGNAIPQTLQVPPAPPGNDLRPDAVRADAVAAKVLIPREQRRVGGRECQVYRTLRGAVSGPLDPITPTANEGRHSDLCFDERGILVEEVGYDADDRIVRRKVLVQLEVDADADATLTDDRFAVTGPDLPLQQGGGSVKQLEPTSRPPGDVFYELSAPPDGYDLRGRYAIVPPQPEAFNDPSRGSTLAGIVDVYAKGPDVLLVERGGTLGGSDPFALRSTSEKVDLAPLGQGEVLLGMTGSEVRALTGGGHYVRVAGTTRAADLVALTRRFTPQPGGELRFLDG